MMSLLTAKVVNKFEVMNQVAASPKPFRGQRVAEECVKLFVKELKGALVPEGRLSNNLPQYLVRQSVQCDTFIISFLRSRTVPGQYHDAAFWTLLEPEELSIPQINTIVPHVCCHARFAIKAVPTLVSGRAEVHRGESTRIQSSGVTGTGTCIIGLYLRASGLI